MSEALLDRFCSCIFAVGVLALDGWMKLSGSTSSD